MSVGVHSPVSSIFSIDGTRIGEKEGTVFSRQKILRIRELKFVPIMGKIIFCTMVSMFKIQSLK